tara:strand:+ start:184 stop:630 length:447 start_codon:yes stop_codon:yes gene_type:complete
MAEIGEIVNSEIKCSLGGKDFVFKKLSIGETLAHFQSLVKGKKIEEAQVIASTLKGADKVAFLKEIWGSLPAGDGLMELVQEELSSYDGIGEILFLANKKTTKPMAREAFLACLSKEDISNLTPIVEFVSNFSVAEDEVGRAEGNVKE